LSGREEKAISNNARPGVPVRMNLSIDIAGQYRRISKLIEEKCTKKE
jgi:hypothetical protein